MDGGTFEITQPDWVSELTPAQQCVCMSHLTHAHTHSHNLVDSVPRRKGADGARASCPC
jgi:hypothetical protein